LIDGEAASDWAVAAPEADAAALRLVSTSAQTRMVFLCSMSERPGGVEMR
jgi:hypothetical protein